MSGGRIILPATDPCITDQLALNVGATLSVYETGTDTLATIYADIGLTTPISNPQISNAAGRFYTQSTQICADDSAAYDVVLAFTDGETFTYDELYPLGAPPNLSGFLQNPNVNLTGVPTAPTAAANNASSQIATTQFVANAIAGAALFPPGAIWMFGSASAVPTGWLPFSTTPVSRTTYAALFGAIGTTWGAGDGSTTFNLPPPGIFARSANTTGSGYDPSRTVGSIQTDAMQGHFHVPLGTSQGSQFGFDVWDTSTGNGHGAPTGVGSNPEATTGAPTTDGTNGTPRTSTETRPVNGAFVFAIKT